MYTCYAGKLFAKYATMIAVNYRNALICCLFAAVIMHALPFTPHVVYINNTAIYCACIHQSFPSWCQQAYCRVLSCPDESVCHAFMPGRLQRIKYKSKDTLCTVLRLQVTGEVTYNEQPLSSFLPQRTAAYVPQVRTIYCVELRQYLLDSSFG